MWGNPDYAVTVNGGDINLQQVNYVDQGQCANTVNGGSLSVNAAFFYKNAEHLTQNGGTTSFIGNMTVKGSKPFDAKINGGTHENRLNWVK
jgi:hypothetical protein